MKKESKKKKEDLDFRYTEERGYLNALSEYDLKNLIAEDRKFLKGQLTAEKSAGHSSYSIEDNEVKRNLIPTFRLRKSIEKFNKATSIFSIILIVLTVIIAMLTAIMLFNKS